MTEQVQHHQYPNIDYTFKELKEVVYEVMGIEIEYGVTIDISYEQLVAISEAMLLRRGN